MGTLVVLSVIFICREDRCWWLLCCRPRPHRPHSLPGQAGELYTPNLWLRCWSLCQQAQPPPALQAGRADSQVTGFSFCTLLPAKSSQAPQAARHGWWAVGAQYWAAFSTCVRWLADALHKSLSDFQVRIQVLTLQRAIVLQFLTLQGATALQQNWDPRVAASVWSSCLDTPWPGNRVPGAAPSPHPDRRHPAALMLMCQTLCNAFRTPGAAAYTQHGGRHLAGLQPPCSQAPHPGGSARQSARLCPQAECCGGRRVQPAGALPGTVATAGHPSTDAAPQGPGCNWAATPAR